ncbi:MAG: glycosyltransferase family 4 protein, partial [Coxiellaceae bacterium]|nr:glycosyltransferase family 4 protein [Coxiellaceae bacterium]
QLLAKRYKVPFVFEMRDVWPDSIVDIGRVSRFNPLVMVMRMMANRLYRSASRILMVMPNAADYLKHKGIAITKLHWLPNFVNFDTVPKPHNNNHDVLHVVYAGSHGLANDLSVVVQSAKQLQDQGAPVKITMIGDGAEREKLQQRAKDLALQNIEFLGSVPKNTIYDHLQGADVFLLLIADAPVFQWGISLNKLFDYLALAKPIISNTQHVYHPTINEPLFYSIKPQDPSALTQAILHFQQMPAKDRQAFAQEGRRYCEQHHDAKELSAQLESILQECVQ